MGDGGERHIAKQGGQEEIVSEILCYANRACELNTISFLVLCRNVQADSSLATDQLCGFGQVPQPL